MSATAFASAFLPAPQLPAPRAFATTPADLEVDFDRSERTALATTILARCCVGDAESSAARENLAWDLPLSARIARLLRIVELTTETDHLAVTQTCAQADCRQAFALTLPFASLLVEAHPAVAAENIVRFPLGNSTPIALRLPTGRDQSAWRHQHYEDRNAALNAIVHSLAVEPRELPSLSPEQLAPLAAAMEAADPLVAFTVQTTCPHCQRGGEFAVDLEAWALRELARFRRVALADVHLLATHYGWTESEVLAIPTRRRADYRNLIAAGEQELS